ncbi:MAG: Uma2 family endonuclease [Pirellulaceae bacterium]|nr:Uma2 family endonuclease [Pirellulaceae bacterium]
MSRAMSATPLAPVPVLPRPVRWSVAEFHRLVSEPWLEGRRMILVEGEILDMPHPNPPHDTSVGLTEDVLRRVFGPGHWVRGQMALVLGQSTDPLPDVAVVAGTPRDFPAHPRTALLVVEVAESSLAYDSGDKAHLYAAGGIEDYWVVDLVHRVLLMHRAPRPNSGAPFGWQFASVTTHHAASVVSPLAAPQASLRVEDLMP